jgi:cytoskeletal protein CcmA (bactofilin family)
MFGGKKDEKTEGGDWTATPAVAQKVESPADARTQIGPGTVIKGDVNIQGEAIIYGTVEGNLTASGAVDVLKGGLVKAEIRGKSVRVAGSVEGKIVSGDKVQLVTGAHVLGDIHSQSLKIEEGVFFQGACVMGENPLGGEKSRVIAMAAEPQLKKVAS